MGELGSESKSADLQVCYTHCLFPIGFSSSFHPTLHRISYHPALARLDLFQLSFLIRKMGIAKLILPIGFWVLTMQKKHCKIALWKCTHIRILFVQTHSGMLCSTEVDFPYDWIIYHIYVSQHLLKCFTYHLSELYLYTSKKNRFPTFERFPLRQ